MTVHLGELHQHLAKYQAAHKALRAHHRHVAHGAAAERKAHAATAPVPTPTLYPQGPAGSEGSPPVRPGYV